MNYELKRLSPGQLIGKSLNLYVDNFLPLLLISIVAAIPSVIYYYILAGIAETQSLGQNLVLSTYIMAFLMAIISTLTTGIIMEIVSRRYLGKKGGKVLRSILPLILPLVGVSFLVSLAAGAAMFLLIIPGIIVWLGFCMATPALVVERGGIIGSMKRSRELAKGKRWYILGILLLGYLITFTVSIVISMIESLFLGTSMFPLISSASPSSETAILLRIIPQIITRPFTSSLLILLYFNLRIEKEGFDLEHLASQFSLEE